MEVIPYARVIPAPRGREFRVCPECGAQVLCRERKDRESFTGREYAEHYRQAHQGEYPRGVSSAESASGGRTLRDRSR